MYQNLNHYQTMLKEIEHHNNKPLPGQEPAKPFQVSNNYMNQTNLKERFPESFAQPSQNQSILPHEISKTYRESPAKDFLRYNNNNMDESSLSHNWRQESTSKARLIPEKSNSPRRESFHPKLYEQSSFQNKSLKSLNRESNQENIPEADV